MRLPWLPSRIKLTNLGGAMIITIGDQIAHNHWRSESV